MFPFFILLRQVFFLSKDTGLFSPLPPSAIKFSIELIDLLITHECDLSFGLLLSSAIQPQAFVFYTFGGWQGGSVTWGGLLEWECKTDHHSSSISRPQGHLAIGSVSRMLWYIHTPPHNRPISQDAKQIIPLTGDTASLGRAPIPEWSPIGSRGLLCCLLNTYAATRG